MYSQKNYNLNELTDFGRNELLETGNIDQKHLGIVFRRKRKPPPHLINIEGYTQLQFLSCTKIMELYSIR